MASTSLFSVNQRVECDGTHQSLTGMQRICYRYWNELACREPGHPLRQTHGDQLPLCVGRFFTPHPSLRPAFGIAQFPNRLYSFRMPRKYGTQFHLSSPVFLQQIPARLENGREKEISFRNFSFLDQFDLSFRI